MTESTHNSRIYPLSEDKQVTILVLLSREKDQQLVVNELGSRYSIRTPDSGITELDFDICLVDEISLSANRNELTAMRDESEPVIRPYLLITQADRSSIEPSVWDLVDDTIATPMSLDELSARVNTLLHLRQRSIECSQKWQLELASILAHDLRNPLAVAKGTLNLARESGSSEHFDRIERSLDQIDELVDSVLTLARQEFTSEDITAISLRDVVVDVWSSSDSGEATLELGFEKPFQIHANPSSLKHLLINLSRNAIEHNDAPVTLTVGPLTDGFYVADDGTGISKAEQESVFQIGYSTQTDGTGLGLSIVTQVIEAHGWSISVTESVDGGARFEITDVAVERGASSCSNVGEPE